MLLPLVAGCLPPLEGGPNDVAGVDSGTEEEDVSGLTARQLFDRDVFPLLDQKCGLSGCHAETDTVNGAFVDDVAAEGYDRAVGEPRLVAAFTADAPLLTKVATGHPATYTKAESDKLVRWLAKEVEERGAQRDLLREFSGCVNISDFQASNMAQWGDVETDEGRCKTCHNLGEFNHVASALTEPYFNMMTSDRTLFGQYFTVDASNTAVIVNNDSFLAVGKGLAPHDSHPLFDPVNGLGMIALRDFHERGIMRMAANLCDPPRF